MDRVVVGLFRLLRFSSGRRLFVLRQVRKLASELANPRLLARVDAAIAHELHVRKLERQWVRTKSKRSTARGDAKLIDAKLDRLISSMYRTVEGLLDTIDPESEHAAKVRAFLDEYFPAGVQEITSAQYEDALAIIEEMNEDFATFSEDDIKALNISYHVPELARLTALFAAELDKYSPKNQVRFSKVRAAREEGHARLLKLVSAILVEYDEHDAEDDEKRKEIIAIQEQLLEPILDANERVAQRRKRRNAPDVEVDPETGEELGEDATILDASDAGDDDEQGADA